MQRVEQQPGERIFHLVSYLRSYERMGLQAILLSPDFWFRLERDVQGGQTTKATDVELATRLSFFLWDAAPDEALLKAAETGEIMTDKGRAKIVDMMVASPRLKDGMRVWWHGVPDSVREGIAAVGISVTVDCQPPVEAAHLFVIKRAVLDCELRLLLPLLAPSGFVWVSWPKKASKVATDITEDAIREVALPMGLVDVMVCAVDGTWSGLKLVIRKDLR